MSPTSPFVSATARLGLGTVQFGMPYGISNAAGQTPVSEVVAILAAAREHGVRVLDTAAGYGNSEAVLGEAMAQLPGAATHFQVVTKTPHLAAAEINEATLTQVQRALEASLVRLGLSRLDTVLVHRADDLLKPGGERLMTCLSDWVGQGLVSRWGVSVYTGAHVDAVLARGVPQLVQVPLNVLDQRLVRQGHLQRLHALGVTVHARSVFLQGVLLMSPTSLGAYFEPYRAHLAAYQAAVTQAGLTPLQAALGFALSCPEVETVLVGVNTRSHWSEILAAADAAHPWTYDASAWADDALLNPALWPPESGSGSR